MVWEEEVKSQAEKNCTVGHVGRWVSSGEMTRGRQRRESKAGEGGEEKRLMVGVRENVLSFVRVRFLRCYACL